MVELRLDGTDWQVTPLVPAEWAWANVQGDDWNPHTVGIPGGPWIPAKVPGDVIHDALDAGAIPHPYKDLQSRACEWISERDWVYRKRFDVPNEWKGKSIRLLFEGVDHACHVFLNGERLGTHQGMLTPFEFDVAERVRFDKPNTLVVVVEHAPPVDQVQGQVGWTNKARVWKPRFAYGWDWCTRLVPVGIWKSVRLVATEAVWIEDVWVRPEFSERDGKARISVTAKGRKDSAGTWKVRARVLDPDGGTVAEGTANVDLSDSYGETVCALEIAQPRLWFPNGLGEQPIYRVHVDLMTDAGAVSDAREATFGFRTIELAPNDGAPPDALPYTFVVNGRRLFVKGWNWVPIDHMYGRVQQDRHERLLRLARNAHCNLLRVWGGGYIERTEFYDLCDRLGILVWQEFMQSSSGIQNAPPEDKEYLDYIEGQARAIVPTRRNHPCLAVWCGGNELMDDKWVPLTSAHPALARLKAVVQELDPGRAWLPTSSSGPVFGADTKHAGTGRMHDVHGPWKYEGPERQYEFFNTIDPLFHGEFGAEGAANLETLRRFVSPQFEFPPDTTNPVWIHHGSWWMHREKIEGMFGPVADIETFVRASQWMQSEGLRYAIESHRRRMGHESGVIPWQLNEAWPNTGCTNAVDYAGTPKPAYWWVRRAYEPIHVSLRYDRLSWSPGETWRGEIWVTKDGATRTGWRCDAAAIAMDGTTLQRWQQDVNVTQGRSERILEIDMTLPDKPLEWLLFLSLFDESGRAVSRNEYLFSSARPLFVGLLNAPETRLIARRSREGVVVRVEGPSPALFVTAQAQSSDLLYPSDDYFCLAPGESRGIEGLADGPARVAAWNAPEVVV